MTPLPEETPALELDAKGSFQYLISARIIRNIIEKHELRNAIYNQFCLFEQYWNDLDVVQETSGREGLKTHIRRMVDLLDIKLITTTDQRVGYALLLRMIRKGK